MTEVDEKNPPKFIYGKVIDTVSDFYWNHIKQNAFWSFCILIPAVIVFTYFAYDYIKGGFITRWEMSKIMHIGLFTILPAGLFLNLVLNYHAYNLIINLGNNFSTPYKLGKQFDSYLSESIGFFFRVSAPFLLFIVSLYYSQQQFNPMIWFITLIAASILYEIVCCTYGLRVAASVNYGYRKPRDWSFQSSIEFFKSHNKQVILYAIISIIGSTLLIGVWIVLAKASTFIALVFAFFAGSFFVMLRVTLHAKLLENGDWITTNNVSPEGDAKLGVFLKKNYVLILSPIVLIVVFAGYSSYQDSKYSDGRLIPDPIAPISREKGTIDYTLVDWIFSDKKYFEHWVLRFPEDATITRPEKPNSKNHNYRLTLYLKMPDMTFLPQGEKKFDKEVTRISINARHQVFKKVTSNYKGGIESGFAGRYNQLNCARDKEITKGFFQMRDATNAEKEAHGSSYKSYLRDKCERSQDNIPFAYYDKAGDLLAKGSCWKSDIFKSEKASCYFRVWLPQGRDAYVDLAPKYLGEFPLIYQKIVTKINDATVIEKSTNLKWRPSSNSQDALLSKNTETTLSAQNTNKVKMLPKKLTNGVNLVLSGCEIPEVGQKDRLILLGTYGASALSNVTILGQDKETSAAEIFIEEGTEPLYLVVTSFEDVIWQVSGATERISNVVLSSFSGYNNGTIGSGVTGVDKAKVSYLRNPKKCIANFSDVDSPDAAQAKGVIHALTGRMPDRVAGIGKIGFAMLPDGPLEKLTRLHNPPTPKRLNSELLHYSPSGVMNFDPDDVVSELPAELYEVLPEEAGLMQLLQEGKIERIKTERYSDEYHINEKIRFPSGLYGAHNVTFHLPVGVPKPDGSPGHSKVCLEETNRDLLRDRACRYLPPNRQ